jgi:hypothetical protein
MAFGEHAREHFVIGLLGCAASIALAMLLRGSWWQVAGWLGLAFSVLWCIGPGHGIIIVGSFLTGLFRLFCGKRD